MAADGNETSSRPQRATTVASLTDIGPRDENQDRVVANAAGNGSWLIAVADGLGGHPRGADASEAAISRLPDRIANPDEMQVAFIVAQNRVAALAPDNVRYRRGMIRECPASTLCVAGWTAVGGLIVGYAGDTVPLLLWRHDGVWSGRSFGPPHRSAGMTGQLTRYMGAPGSGVFDMHGITEVTDVPFAVVIASDGVWEPLVSETYAANLRPPDPIAAAVAACLTAADLDADAIAARIMATARSAGLDDNATVAVAAVGRGGPSDADAA